LERAGDGVFTIHGSIISRFSSFMLLSVFFVPMVMILAAATFGWLVAVFEKWDADSGVFYMVYAMGASAIQLVQMTPAQYPSKIATVVMAMLGFVVTNCIMGITSVCRQVQATADVVPPTWIGFVILMVVLCPLALLVILIILAAILTHVEGWTFDNSFFSSTDYLLTGGNLFHQHASIKSLDGLFSFIVTQCLIICLTGGMLGALGAHSFTRRLLAFIEGGEAQEIGNDKAAGKPVNPQDKPHVMCTNEERKASMEQLLARKAYLQSQLASLRASPMLSVQEEADYDI
jgi:hypothetical protein